MKQREDELRNHLANLEEQNNEHQQTIA